MAQPPYHNHAVPGSNPGGVKNTLIFLFYEEYELIKIYNQLLLLIESLFESNNWKLLNLHLAGIEPIIFISYYHTSTNAQ